MPTLAHVNLRTGQLATVVEFYAQTLGFRPGRAETRPDSSQHVWLYDSAGLPALHVQSGTGAAPLQPAEQGFHHLAFNCSDASAWVERLSRLGVVHEHQQMRGGLEQINLRDPDGILIELTFGAELLRMAPVSDLPRDDLGQ